jgi:hypothetical protein
MFLAAYAIVFIIGYFLLLQALTVDIFHALDQPVYSFALIISDTAGQSQIAEGMTA